MFRPCQIIIATNFVDVSSVGARRLTVWTVNFEEAGEQPDNLSKNYWQGVDLIKPPLEALYVQAWLSEQLDSINTIWAGSKLFLQDSMCAQ